MIAYRDGRPGDGAAVAALYRECFVATFGHLYAAEDLSAFLANGTAAAFDEEIATPGFAFRLAEDDGSLAGFVKVGPDQLPNAEAGSIELWALYVRAPWHGSGLAAGLMEWAIGEARRRDARVMRLTVYVDNHRARRFYERYGFEEVGKYVFMVGNHEDDDRIMRLAL